MHTWFTHDAKKSKPGIRRKKLVDHSHSKGWATGATKMAAVQTTSVSCRHSATQVTVDIGKHSATQVTAKDLHFFRWSKSTQVCINTNPNKGKQATTQTVNSCANWEISGNLVEVVVPNEVVVPKINSLDFDVA